MRLKQFPKFSNTRNSVRIIILTFVLSFSVFWGQSNSRFAIETDPVTFAFEGYAFHVKYSPQGWEHIQLGVGTYSMNFPDILVDLNPENANEGWDVQLKQGIGLFTDYYFNTTQDEWYLGGQLAIQEYRIKNSDTGSDHQDFSNFLIMPYVGYRWFPADGGIYIQPWMGIGYTEQISGSTQLGDKNYDVSPILPYFAVHIGYRF